MRKNDGRKLDHHTLEAIRLRAVEQGRRRRAGRRGGARPGRPRPAPEDDLHLAGQAADRGRAALRARPVPGPRRKLSDAQLGELTALITDTDPRDHGFVVALWTREIVRQLIEARFGVALTVASVGRTLHELGFSAQRPFYRADQADPAAVARWTETEYPKIAAAAKAAGG